MLILFRMCFEDLTSASMLAAIARPPNLFRHINNSIKSFFHQTVQEKIVCI